MGFIEFPSGFLSNFSWFYRVLLRFTGFSLHFLFKCPHYLVCHSKHIYVWNSTFSFLIELLFAFFRHCLSVEKLPPEVTSFPVSIPRCCCCFFCFFFVFFLHFGFLFRISVFRRTSSRRPATIDRTCRRPKWPKSSTPNAKSSNWKCATYVSAIFTEFFFFNRVSSAFVVPSFTELYRVFNRVSLSFFVIGQGWSSYHIVLPSFGWFVRVFLPSFTEFFNRVSSAFFYMDPLWSSCT